MTTTTRKARLISSLKRRKSCFSSATAVTASTRNSSSNVIPTKDDTKNKSTIMAPAPSDEWRRFGEARRAELVAQDEAAGGTSFQLNKSCRIQRYFQLADRVRCSGRKPPTHTHTLDFLAISTAYSHYCFRTHSLFIQILVQFRESSKGTDLEETYVMGHRLVSFLSVALPKHVEYRNTAMQSLRNKSFQDLLMIQQEMEALAVKIDEDHLNRYIMNFDPVQEDDDDSSTSSDESDNLSFSDLAKETDTWESFEGGWSYDLSSGDETPVVTDTDVSADSHDARQCHGRRGHGARRARDGDSDDEDDAPDPEPHLDFDEDDEGEEERVRDLRYSLKDALADSILEQIADEAVRFETDSEAVDSWAQDGDSNALSGASSGTALTYDPARLAFREIMNRVPRNGDYAHEHETVGTPPPPPPPAPANSPAIPAHIEVDNAPSNKDSNGEADEDWSSFAFASVRRAQQ